MFRSGNPALNEKTFSNVIENQSESPMTIKGTVRKSMAMLGLLVLSFAFVWTKALQVGSVEPIIGWVIFGGIGGFILALATIFKKEWAPYTAPFYAVAEGLVLGGVSAIFEAQYPGIVFQAVGLTFGTFFSLLFAYNAKIINVTDNFRSGVFAATGGIALLYLASFILGFFGIQLPLIHSSGIFGIGFSVFVVIIAALNLVLDFDFIEKAAKQNLPKYFEWYSAFSLLVTLVWLYMEILRLLAKLNSRRD